MWEGEGRFRQMWEGEGGGVQVRTGVGSVGQVRECLFLCTCDLGSVCSRLKMADDDDYEWVHIFILTLICVI